MYPGMGWPDLQRSGIVTNGLGEAPLAGQDSSQIIMRFRKVGLTAEGFHILLDRFLRLTLTIQSGPQVIVCPWIARPEPERGGIVTDGLGEASLVRQGHSQGIMRFRMVGLEAERFHTLLDRFLCLAL